MIKKTMMGNTAWTACGPTVHSADTFVIEASCLGLKPGYSPQTVTVPKADGMIGEVGPWNWEAVREHGELLFWKASAFGCYYEIFND